MSGDRSGGRHHWQRRRGTVVADEAIFQRAEIVYLRRGHHPLVASIMAHETATDLRKSASFQPRELRGIAS